jgi:hypothetical protein
VKHVGRKKWLGLTDPGDCTISLSSKNQNDEELLHTFYHELMHAVLFTMGNEKLYRDEFIIDGIGGLLAQFATTSK